MKLSIVILCWNDQKVVAECLRTIYATTHSIDFEIIISDNGSTDKSAEFVRETYPQVRVIENGRNLRFAKGNNVGIRASCGEYVLILNPDTIMREGTLETMIRFADEHPEAGAFACRVLNPDGSYQVSARPFASLRGEWIAGLYLRGLGRLGRWFVSDTYPGWQGETERNVDWVMGCFILVRANLLKQIGGFDERFFYYYEDMDLCRRIWESGNRIIYTPSASIIHLKGQSTSLRLPAITFALDGQVTRYLYYHKYYGKRGMRRARRISLAALSLRYVGYSLLQLISPTNGRKSHLELLRAMLQWNFRVDPVRLLEQGIEPTLDGIKVQRIAER